MTDRRDRGANGFGEIIRRRGLEPLLFCGELRLEQPAPLRLFLPDQTGRVFNPATLSAYVRNIVAAAEKG
jgi:hypothetical protein